MKYHISLLLLTEIHVFFYSDVRSERPVELSLAFETPSRSASSTTALLWTGISNRPLNKIEPSCFVDVALTLVPILPGLQTVSGLRLFDLFLKRTYDYDDLAQVLVLPYI